MLSGDAARPGKNAARILLGSACRKPVKEEIRQSCNLRTIRAVRGLGPFRVCLCWTNPKKAPKKNLRGFVIPIGFKPITF